MATEVFKVPQNKRSLPEAVDIELWSPTKKKKIKDNFLSFCDIVLAYTQYNTLRNQELRVGNRSPLDSGGSTADSLSSDVAYPSEEDHDSADSPTNEMIADDSSFDEVSCFCGKPYMGRPMIECSVCYNWLHLSCVHLRKNNIPETFTCDACKCSPPQQQSMGARRRAQHRKLQRAYAERVQMSSFTPNAHGVAKSPFTTPIRFGSNVTPPFMHHTRGSMNGSMGAIGSVNRTSANAHSANTVSTFNSTPKSHKNHQTQHTTDNSRHRPYERTTQAKDRHQSYK